MRVRICRSVIPMIWVLSAAAGARGEPGVERPAEYVDRYAKRVIGILDEKGRDMAERRRDVESMVLDEFDFDVISKLVLATHWRRATPVQRNRFSDLFRSFLSSVYGRHFEKYSNQRYSIVEERAEPRGDWTVRTILHGSTGNEYRIDFRLRRRGAGWKVIDMRVEGVSLVANYRSEFNSIVHREGVDGLLGRLQDRVASRRAGEEGAPLSPAGT